MDTIYCDIDGTLVLRSGEINRTLLEWLATKEAEGNTIMLWSARPDNVGKTIFNKVVIPKPTVMLDDKGIGWMRYVKVVKSNRELI